jgi:hypothetical protein
VLGSLRAFWRRLDRQLRHGIGFRGCGSSRNCAKLAAYLR